MLIYFPASECRVTCGQKDGLINRELIGYEQFELAGVAVIVFVEDIFLPDGFEYIRDGLEV